MIVPDVAQGTGTRATATLMKDLGLPIDHRDVFGEIYNEAIEWPRCSCNSCAIS